MRHLSAAIIAVPYDIAVGVICQCYDVPFEVGFGHQITVCVVGVLADAAQRVCLTAGVGLQRRRCTVACVRVRPSR